MFQFEVDHSSVTSPPLIMSSKAITSIDAMNSCGEQVELDYVRNVTSANGFSAIRAPAQFPFSFTGVVSNSLCTRFNATKLSPSHKVAEF